MTTAEALKRQKAVKEAVEDLPHEWEVADAMWLNDGSVRPQVHILSYKVGKTADEKAKNFADYCKEVGAVPKCSGETDEDGYYRLTADHPSGAQLFMLIHGGENNDA